VADDRKTVHVREQKLPRLLGKYYVFAGNVFRAHGRVFLDLMLLEELIAGIA
jgi:hypothetical protein